MLEHFWILAEVLADINCLILIPTTQNLIIKPFLEEQEDNLKEEIREAQRIQKNFIVLRKRVVSLQVSKLTFLNYEWFLQWIVPSKQNLKKEKKAFYFTVRTGTKMALFDSLLIEYITKRMEGLSTWLTTIQLSGEATTRTSQREYSSWIEYHASDTILDY